MSVEVEVYVVEWNEFKEKVSRLGESDALETLQPEPLTWTSWRAAGQFVWIFEAMDRAWRTAGKKRFATILDVLFGSWRSKSPVMELGIDPSELDGIETALSPASVRDLAGMADEVDLRECEALFEKASLKAGVDRFEYFEEYTRYATEWLGILRKAAGTGKGLVIVAYA